MNITTGNFVIPLPKVFSSTSDKLILVAVTNTCEETWNGRVGSKSEGTTTIDEPPRGSGHATSVNPLISVLERSEFLPPSVGGFGDEENMCQLSLEWSEAVVSCSGDVTYTVTATPYLSLSEISTTDTQLNTSVNGNICLVHNITVTTEICEGRIVENISLSLNLTAKSIGSVSSYYYSVHNIMTQAIEAVNVTWPRFRVLSDETVYKLIIDDEEVVSDVSEENCGREMCG
jgi:hypothetical protein